jgi:hypothetical protein
MKETERLRRDDLHHLVHRHEPGEACLEDQIGGARLVGSAR